MKWFALFLVLTLTGCFNGLLPLEKKEELGKKPVALKTTKLPPPSEASAPVEKKITSEATAKPEQADILVNYTNPMKVGKTYDVVIRVALDKLLHMTENLPGNRSVETTIRAAEHIRMLVYSKNVRCNISTTSPATQMLLRGSYVEWTYSIQPLDTGSGSLIVVPILVNSKGEAEVGSKQIEVNVTISPSWLKAKFLLLMAWMTINATALKMLGGSIAAVVTAGWTYYQYKKKKRSRKGLHK
jgi:hypothetical protein